MNTITQTQISSYEQCKRLYYLKMIRKLVWPVEPQPRGNIQEGDAFHLLARQLLLGFPADALIIPDGDENVKRWLGIYLAEQPIGKAEQVFAELEVSTVFADVLWLGKFDALAIQEDQIKIYDWKTGAAKPDAEHYRRSPQTRLYRFLARSCASRLIGSGLHEFPAENIEMVYWFPEHPAQTIHLPYSEEDWQQDLTWLKTRALEMNSENENDYPMTAKTRQCKFCPYRTWCYPDSAVSSQSPEEIPDFEEIMQPELFLTPPLPNGENEEFSF